MGEALTANVIWAGLSAMIAAAIVLSWPYRREWRFVLRRLIAAPPEAIWDVYHPGAETEAHAAFHREIHSVRRLDGLPVTWELVVDGSGGHGTHLMTLRYQSLNEQRPARSELRHSEIDGRPYPFGEAHRETLELEARPDGTLVSLGFSGEIASLWQLLHLWRHHRRYLGRLQRFCEGGGLAPEISKGRAFWTSLALSAVALVSFALLFGWAGALLIAGILVIHEFGHWLAMRLTGQPAPKLLLIPFFGGVAVANHPHRTLFDDAFCALMGPGLSALPALALLLAAWALGVPDMAAFMAAPSGPVADLGAQVKMALALGAVAIATAIGALNLLQMVPVLPLDGGQILRAFLQSFGASWARRILLAVTGLGILGLGYAGDYILAGILGLGALQAWYLGEEAPEARPMSAAGASVLGLGYVLTLGIHAAALYFGLQVMGIDIL
ncbi:MAG: hypothetical protein QNJ30_15860 [Kiloniellales bacterium]|nr:hypothetical protein [Kiloniellales bacterium]